MRLATPRKLQPALDDPAAALRRVRSGAPYRLLSVADRSYETDHHEPWFKAYWAVPGRILHPEAEPLLHEPRLIAAACESFDAQIARPHALMVNLMGPTPGGVAHYDLPHFRGAPARTHDMELLYAMGRSGLFERWALRIASALIWFQAGEGGGFEYWPEGPDRPSRVAAPPLWNTGLMGDNDRMLHRAQAVGPQDEELPKGLLRRSARLHAAGDGALSWEIRDADRVIVRYPRERVRISILWKAQVFEDARDAARFDEGRDELDPSTIVRVFADFASQRDIRLPETRDPRRDRSWIEAVGRLC